MGCVLARDTPPFSVDDPRKGKEEEEEEGGMYVRSNPKPAFLYLISPSLSNRSRINGTFLIPRRRERNETTVHAGHMHPLPHVLSLAPPFRIGTVL